MQQKVAEKVGAKDVAKIQTEMHVAKVKSSADALIYQITKEAEGNKAKLTTEYVQLESFKAALHNATMYFGSSIPSALLTKNIVPTESIF